MHLPVRATASSNVCDGLTIIFFGNLISEQRQETSTTTTTTTTTIVLRTCSTHSLATVGGGSGCRQRLLLVELHLIDWCQRARCARLIYGWICRGRRACVSKALRSSRSTLPLLRTGWPQFQYSTSTSVCKYVQRCVRYASRHDDDSVRSDDDESGNASFGSAMHENTARTTTAAAAAATAEFAYDTSRTGAVGS